MVFCSYFISHQNARLYIAGFVNGLLMSLYFLMKSNHLIVWLKTCSSLSVISRLRRSPTCPSQQCPWSTTSCPRRVSTNFVVPLPRLPPARLQQVLGFYFNPISQLVVSGLPVRQTRLLQDYPMLDAMDEMDLDWHLNQLKNKSRKLISFSPPVWRKIFCNIYV